MKVPGSDRKKRPAGHRVVPGRAPAGGVSDAGVQEAAGNQAVQRLFDEGAVQAKLSLGRPNDPLEEEADRAAERFVVQRKAGGCGTHCDCEDCRTSRNGVIRRRTAAGMGGGRDVAGPGAVGLGRGLPLDPPQRRRFESGFDRDFGGVRVHVGASADAAAQRLRARAFTIGGNIAFARGEYAPNTRAGDFLLAHELAHVAQQGHAPPRDGALRPIHVGRDRATRTIRRWGGYDSPNPASPTGPRAVGVRADGTIDNSDKPKSKPLKDRTEEERIAEIRSILSNTWVGPLNEARLEALWNSFGESLPEVAGRHLELWTQSKERGAELDDIDAAKKMPHAKAGTWGNVAKAELRQDVRQADTFETQEEAITFARSLGAPAAIYKEKERFIVITMSYDTLVDTFTYDDVKLGLGSDYATVVAESGVLAIVTEDGNVLTPNKIGEWMSIRKSLKDGAKADPYASHKKVFGEGLSDIKDKNQFLRVFDMAMRDSALTILDNSKLEAERQRDELSSSIPEKDRATIERVTGALIKIDDAVSKLGAEIGDLRRAQYAAGRGHLPKEVQRVGREIEKKEEDIRMLGTFRKTILLSYPLLSHVGDVKGFSKMGDAGKREKLYNTTNEVLKNIQITRENVLSGSLNLWAVDPIVKSTLVGLGVKEGEQHTWATEKAASEKRWDSIIQIAMAVFQIGFSIAAVAVGGPVGAAFAVAALGVGVTDAVMMTDRYLQNVSAAGTDVNTAEALVPGDLGAEWVWVALAWVGVGLDMADAVRAVRAIKAGTSTMDEVIPALAKEHELEEAALRRAVTKTVDDETARVLEKTAKKEILEPAELATELREVQRRRPTRITEGDYVAEVDLGNGHKWKYNQSKGTWCRFTGAPKNCTPMLPPAGVATTTGELAADAAAAGRVGALDSLEKVEAFRSTLAARPPGVKSAQDLLDWADYSYYAERRLKMIEEAIQKGETLPPPPRTFESFQASYPPGHVIRNNIQGSRFEERTRKVFEEVLGPDWEQRVLDQPHLSEKLDPSRAKGEMTRPDFLLRGDAGKHLTAVSNKSRQSFVGMSEASARAQVIRDLEEAIDKYTGLRSVRKLEGATDEVTRVILLYDAASVPETLRGPMRAVAAEMQKMYPDGKLVLEVGIF